MAHIHPPRAVDMMDDQIFIIVSTGYCWISWTRPQKLTGPKKVRTTPDDDDDEQAKIIVIIVVLKRRSVSVDTEYRISKERLILIEFKSDRNHQHHRKRATGQHVRNVIDLRCLCRILNTTKKRKSQGKITFIPVDRHHWRMSRMKDDITQRRHILIGWKYSLSFHY